MSVYFQAQCDLWKTIVSDAKEGRIDGIRWDETAKPRDADYEQCLTDGVNYGWILKEEGTTGLKQWGMNDVSNIKRRLEMKYNVSFIHEGDLGIMHFG